MDTRITRKTAILIDGGFYKKRAYELWGKKSANGRNRDIHIV